MMPTFAAAGNVTFVLSDNVWTDVRYKKTGTVLQVKPFSDAYFKLLEMLPDLREPFSVGERVIVVGPQHGYRADFVGEGTSHRRRRNSGARPLVTE